MDGSEPTNRAGPDLRDPCEPRYGQINQRFGDPESRPKNPFFNRQFALSRDIDLCAFGRAHEVGGGHLTHRLQGTTLHTPLFPKGFLPLEGSTSTDSPSDTTAASITRGD